MYNQKNSFLRVAAYCRVSTDHKDQLNSLSSQRNYFKDYIAAHNDWTLIHIFHDEGISGTQTKNRTGFRQMMEAAYHGTIDLILTKEVSRFARNTVDTLSYTRQLKELNIGVLFILDHIDTRDCDGELRLTLMASIAQEESRKTSERVKWGQTRRMEQGIVFGRDLLGYRVTNGVLTINEAEASIVRLIFEQYTYKNKSTVAIARELTQLQIPTKRGSAWSASVISRILHNEKYVGDLCQKKSCTPNYLTHKKIANPDASSLIRIKDHHQPIIERDLWNLTQEKLQQRACASPNSYRNHPYWCSGLIRCGLCGQTFVSRTKRRKDLSIYHAWRCKEAACCGTQKTDARGNRIGCDNISINEETLLTCVRYAFCDMQLPFASADSCRDHIESISVYPDHTLLIQLKKAPCAHRLTVCTRGRLKTYQTEILLCERIECLQ